MDKVLLTESKDSEVTCSVCSKKLTRYGSKKLQDGILCRNCVKLASSWYDDKDYAAKTVEQIKEHLQYREANKEKLGNFKAEKAVDGKYSLYVDDNARQFVISKRENLTKENADVFDYDQITNLRIIERKYRNRDGSDIVVEVKLNHPQFERLRFRANEFTALNRESEEYKQAVELAYKYVNALSARK